MGNTPWKVHERAVASHFGTVREKRGADFSVSDCDVLVNVADWYEYMGRSVGSCPLTHIVIECKYSSNLKLHQWMRDFSSTIKNSKMPIMFWDDDKYDYPEYAICWLDNFESAWEDFVVNRSLSLVEFFERWQPGYITRKVPGYLEDFWLQAYNYCCELQKPPGERNTNFRAPDERVLRQECVAYPLVSVRAKKLKGRLMVWKLWWEPEN